MFVKKVEFLNGQNDHPHPFHLKHSLHCQKTLSRHSCQTARFTFTAQTVMSQSLTLTSTHQEPFQFNTAYTQCRTPTGYSATEDKG